MAAATVVTKKPTIVSFNSRARRPGLGFMVSLVSCRFAKLLPRVSRLHLHASNSVSSSLSGSLNCLGHCSQARYSRGRRIPSTSAAMAEARPLKTQVLQSEGGLKPFVKEYNLQEWKFNAVNIFVLVPTANGSEEMEVVIVVEVLRRAGFKVTLTSMEKELQILASRNVKIVVDQFLHDVPASNFDMTVFPGGTPGAERLRDYDLLTKLLSKRFEVKKPLGAICAAPAVVFEPKGLLKGCN